MMDAFMLRIVLHRLGGWLWGCRFTLSTNPQEGFMSTLGHTPRLRIAYLISHFLEAYTSAGVP